MKPLPILLISFLCASLCHAQVRFGIKGGVNLATVRYIETDDSKARLGWNAGVAAEIPVQDNLFVRPELLYSSKGFGYRPTATSMQGSLRLNYIAVPLLFGFRPGRRTAIMAGPEIGFLQKAVSKSQGITSDFTGFYRHFDVGVDLGFAYTVSKDFGIEARYNYGFKDLVNVAYLNDNGDVIAQGKNGANSVLQVGIYYWVN